MPNVEHLYGRRGVLKTLIHLMRKRRYNVQFKKIEIACVEKQPKQKVADGETGPKKNSATYSIRRNEAKKAFPYGKVTRTKKSMTAKQDRQGSRDYRPLYKTSQNFRDSGAREEPQRALDLDAWTVRADSGRLKSRSNIYGENGDKFEHTGTRLIGRTHRLGNGSLKQ